MASPGFWDNREKAQNTVQEASELRSKLGPLTLLQKQLEDLEILKQIAAG
ncbi:MAG: peptide chain release factor 2, partial [Verrucomicrobia bacterium]